MSIELMMPSNHLILCHSLLLLPSIFPSIRVFSGESALHIRWPKYWSFNVSFSPSNEYAGLISFRIDWLDLLAVQGTLKSLLSELFVSSELLSLSLSLHLLPSPVDIELSGWKRLGCSIYRVDQPRQHIKKQRYYFANKGLSSQSYGFSSSHAWIWEFDYKESWAPKNLCFWTVVLEKTLEGPLVCKEIQPVHPKGNRSWIFIGRIDAKAETPILSASDVKNWLIWKDPDAGKDWRQEEKGMTEDETVGWHHQLNGHEFE